MMIPFRAAPARRRIDCEPASGGTSILDFDSIRICIMKWETPAAVDFRFGMEITMYIANR